jgi:gamma-glutamylcyclotransferase (GGCT)/AIG2-like uncharacterized protein YtfP
MTASLPYFAYGSNMDPLQMRVRCPGARPIGAAKLAQHRWLINTDGYATVVPSAQDTVYGVLWQVTTGHLAALDEYEGVAEGIYWRTEAMVEPMSGGTAIRALIYHARSEKEGKPVPEYMEHILRTAKEFSFPGNYLRELSAWAG